MYEDLINKLLELPHLLFVQLGEYEGVVYQATDAIEELIRDLDSMNDANIALYGALPKWIPVTERLPKEDETVMTWGKQEVVLLDWLHDNQWCCFGEATYWMPLPQPPKEE